MKILFFIVCACFFFFLDTQGKRCGICSCSNDKTKVLCSGNFIEFPSVFSNLTFSKIKTLGLQRNKIRTVSLDYINKFHQLQVLDVSDQDIGGSRCVYLEFDPSLYKIQIIVERNDAISFDVILCRDNSNIFYERLDSDFRYHNYFFSNLTGEVCQSTSPSVEITTLETKSEPKSTRRRKFPTITAAPTKRPTTLTIYI